MVKDRLVNGSAGQCGVHKFLECLFSSEDAMANPTREGASSRKHVSNERHDPKSQLSPQYYASRLQNATPRSGDYLKRMRYLFVGRKTADTVPILPLSVSTLLFHYGPLISIDVDSVVPCQCGTDDPCPGCSAKIGRFPRRSDDESPYVMHRNHVGAIAKQLDADIDDLSHLMCCTMCDSKVYQHLDHMRSRIARVLSFLASTFPLDGTLQELKSRGRFDPCGPCSLHRCSDSRSPEAHAMPDNVRTCSLRTRKKSQTPTTPLHKPGPMGRVRTQAKSGKAAVPQHASPVGVAEHAMSDRSIVSPFSTSRMVQRFGMDDGLSPFLARRGIVNKSNSCYFGSLLQMLTYHDSLCELLVEQGSHSSPLDACFAKELGGILRSIHDTSRHGGSIDIDGLLGMFNNGRFAGRTQEDPAELLETIVTRLTLECGEEQVARVFSPVELVGTRTCLSCGNICSVGDTSIVLHVPLSTATRHGPSTLSALLMSSVCPRADSRSGVHCTSCDSCTDQSATLDFLTVPDFLFVNLKRVTRETPLHGHESYRKDLTVVSIDQRMHLNLSMGAAASNGSHSDGGCAEFKLCSVLVHVGSHESYASGHWYCVGSASIDEHDRDGWYVMDDANVTKAMSLDDVLSPSTPPDVPHTPVLFLYRRTDFKTKT